jgi:hypothetical protein
MLPWWKLFHKLRIFEVTGARAVPLEAPRAIHSALLCVKAGEGSIVGLRIRNPYFYIVSLIKDLRPEM